MIGIGRSLIVLQMAAHARGAGQVVIVADMAIGTLARRHGVHARQGKICHVVIERSVRPRSRVVALGASLRKVGCRVVGILGSLIILQVAAHACRASQVEVVVDVAILALPGWNCMAACEGKANRTVIEIGIQPGIGAVTSRAGCGESTRSMIRIIGRFEVRRVTRVALRRHRLELATGCTFVTRIAIYGRMRAGEREAVVMLLHLLYGNLPSTHRVALLAIGSELPLVNVGMAVLASLSYAREYRLYVTLCTRNSRVHSAQWVSRTVVIEFRYGPDRFPRTSRVAILARNIQISVWTVRARYVLRLSVEAHAGKCEETQRDYLAQPASPHGLAPC